VTRNGGRSIRTVGYAVAALLTVSLSMSGTAPQAVAASHASTQLGAVYVEGHRVGNLYSYICAYAGSERQVSNNGAES
jgi:hypothetical protein